MIDKNIQKSIDQIRQISLSSKEKSVLWATLNDYAVSSPVVAKKNYLSWTLIKLHKPLSYSLVGLLLIALATGTTVLASERSLPGDILYPLKIHVIEPVSIALAPTPEKKDQVRVSQIEERLKEAETLAIQGRLTTSTTAEIKNNIENKVQSISGNLSSQNKEDLEVKTSAHSVVIKSIEKHSSSGQETDLKSIGDFLDNQIASSSIPNQDKTTDKNEQGDHLQNNGRSFLNQKSQTEKTIQNTSQKILRNINHSDPVGLDILNQASNTISEAQKNIKEAENNYTQNRQKEADSLIKNSSQDARRASISVDRVLELSKIKHKKGD